MHLNPAALRVIRERSGYSVSSLAAAVGIQQPHLSNIEKGRRGASPDLIQRIAAELKIPLGAILNSPVRDEVAA